MIVFFVLVITFLLLNICINSMIRKGTHKCKPDMVEEKRQKNRLKDGAASVMPRYFCTVYDYAVKADLNKSF